MPIPFIRTSDLLRSKVSPVKVEMCIRKGWCPISGTKLEPEGGWFIGWPKQFLHPAGAFRDLPVRYDCLEWALKVDARTAWQSLGIDPLPEIVAVGLPSGMEVIMTPMQGVMFKPTFPWRRIEFWHMEGGEGRKLEPHEWETDRPNHGVILKRSESNERTTDDERSGEAAPVEPAAESLG